MTAPQNHPRDPLHGVTLEKVLLYLVEKHGWEEMGRRIPIRCFLYNPSLKSSLTFLRKTPWARQKVEAWYCVDRRGGFGSGPSPAE
ncbi:DUF2132 domain-containing protein [bacterium]|jgi:uncharacterized protein (DUF2132 family)|nr:DUF2132 domain-containing protein [bacterium]